MKKTKLILSILLIITVCCTTVITSFTANAYANIDNYPDFDVDVYVAGLMSDDENPLCRTIKNQIALDSPNDVVINQLKCDVEFQASYAAWQIATFKGGDTVSDSCTEVGYYQSLILSTINASLTSSYIKDVFDNAVIKNSKHFLSAFTNILKSEFVFTDLSDLNVAEMSQEEQIKVMDAFSSSFKKIYPGISDASKFVGIFSTIVKEGKTLETAINNLTAYTESVGMNDYMKAVVSDLYKNCDSSNVAMKLALFEINNACQSYELAYTAAIFDAASSSLSVVCEKVVNTMFDGIMAANPAGLSIMIGQALGKSVANLLFSTDAICEQYHKMCCLYEFEELLGKVTKLEMSSFSNNKTNANANKFFSTIDFLYKEYDVSCDLAKKYANIIFKESIAGVFALNSDGYNNYISSVESMRSIAESNYSFLKGNVWTCFLEEDYPDIYEALNKEDEEIENPYIPVTDIKFEKDSVEWGTEDAFLNYDKAMITPSNASLQSIEYTSSDTSVVSYNKFGAVVHKAGTSVITATSISSGLTATLNVTVVNGKGADGIALEDPKPNEQITIGETFTVGNNRYNIITENAVGVISGAPNVNGVVTIPETVCYKNNLFYVTKIIDGKGATGAARGAFTNGGSYYNKNTSVKRIILPNTITYIGRYAFCYCKNLLSVEIPDGVVSLGFSLFDYSGVVSVTIPQSLQSLGGCGVTWNTYSNKGFLIRDVYYYGSLDNWLNLPDATGDYCGLKNVAKVHIMHTHKYSLSDVKEPTYTETGERTYTCICGDSYAEVINMLPTEEPDVTPSPKPTKEPEITDSPKPTDEPEVTASPKPTDKPEVTTSPKPTGEPEVTASPKPTEGSDVTTSPKPTEQPNVTGNSEPTDGTNIASSPSKGTILEDNDFKVSYKILIQSETVAFYQVNNKKATKIVVPMTVTIDGIKYKVTAISDNAFSGCKKLKAVTTGRNVTTIGNKAFFNCTSLRKITIPASVIKIGKKAFYGCKKLKTITIKTKKLKSKFVGTQAFKGIYKTAVVKVPKKQKKVYQKWLRKKGITKKMKIK